MAVSAERLFATLEDGPSWSKWANGIRNVEWTSPKPHGPGTTRTVTLVGGVIVDELFSVWEQNRRFGFSVTATSAAWLDGLAEIYEVEPIDDHRCTMGWTVAVRFNGLASCVESIFALGFPVIQRQMMRKLERVAEKYRG